PSSSLLVLDLMSGESERARETEFPPFDGLARRRSTGVSADTEWCRRGRALDPA
ncbi:MAG: hypothetical protein ACI81R_002824, partial [Bradymonadia bacterium]